MRLWTIQPYCVYELLELTGIYTCNPNLYPLLDTEDFVNAYKWISKQMRKRIGNPPKSVEYPVWAWYLIEGENKRPDMRKNAFKVFEKSVLLEIEVPDCEVLLTEHVLWHCVLNDCIIYKTNFMENISDDEWYKLADEEDAYYFTLSNKNRKLYKEKSWEKAICSADTNWSYVQAAFWSLKKSQVRKVWFLKN